MITSATGDEITFFLFDGGIQVADGGMGGKPVVDTFVGDGFTLVEGIIHLLGQTVVVVCIHRQTVVTFK